MQRYNNMVCISYGELVNSGVMSSYNFRNYVNRGNLEVVRSGGNGREALVNYDTMPEKYKAKIRSLYGNDIREVATKNTLKDFLEWDVQAEKFFNEYRYENGTFIKPDKRKQYTATASALNAINAVMNARKAKRKSMGGTGISPMFWNNIIEALKAFQMEWGYKIPYTERNIRRILTSYKGNNYASLISGKDCNSNAVKTKADEQQSVLRQILRHPNNLNDEQVAYMYNAICKERGWKCITAGTVAARRDEWKLNTTIGRHGEQYFNNKMAMQVKRTGPGYPMLYWTFDGWDAELFYQRTFINDAGNSITTYHNRLNVVVVLDAYTKYPMGIAIGVEEKASLIKKAIRNALLHTKELFGCIYRPNQVQSDRFAIKQITDFLENITPKYTPAQAHNAKAKVIEPYFEYFNRTYLQKELNWSGHNITSNADGQPNAEFKNKYKHLFPDLQGCITQLLTAIQSERELKAKQLKEKFNELDSYYKLSWTTEQYLYHAGDTTGYTNRLQHDGITLTLNKQEYNYDCFDADFRRYSHLDWVLKYDLSDMNTVLAHTIDGTRRFILEQKHLQPMALVERKEGDAAKLQQVLNYNTQLKEQIANDVAEDVKLIEQMAAENPQISDSLHKILLTDSQGQHKIHKQKAAIKRKVMRLEAKEQKRIEHEEIQQQQSAQVKYWEEKIGDINEYIN